VVAAIEGVDTVLRIGRDACNFDEAPALRELLLSFEDFVLQFVSPYRHGSLPSFPVPS
tara:strand:+ start:4052 stop:4225 length:174 start_codon:yes stop_codon:yes gene_type:complete